MRWYMTLSFIIVFIAFAAAYIVEMQQLEVPPSILTLSSAIGLAGFIFPVLVGDLADMIYQ